MRIVSIIIIILCLSGGFQTAYCCTGFVASADDALWIGNNEDYFIDFTDTVVHVVQTTDNRYGCLLVGFGNQEFSMGGFNDQGLFYDWFSVPPNENWRRLPDRENYPGFLPEDMLYECANIDEAIAFFFRYNLDIFYQNHVFLVDRDGRAAVVEWGVDDLEVIWKEDDFFVVTNFYLSHPDWGWYPCWRYSTAYDMLSNSDEYSWDLSRQILDAVHMDYSTVKTQYSNVYDLLSGRLSFFNNSNFHEYINFSLSDELVRNTTYHIQGMMSDITLIEPAENAHVEGTQVEIRWSGKTSSRYDLMYSLHEDMSDPITISINTTHAPPFLPACLGILWLGAIGGMFCKSTRKKALFCLPLLLLPLMTCSDTGSSDDNQNSHEIIPYDQEFSVTLTDLQPDTTYYWKILALADDNSEHNSQSIIWNFTLN